MGQNEQFCVSIGLCIGSDVLPIRHPVSLAGPFSHCDTLSHSRGKRNSLTDTQLMITALRKTLTFSLLVVLSLSLVSCDSGGSGSEDSPDTLIPLEEGNQWTINTIEGERRTFEVINSTTVNLSIGRRAADSVGNYFARSFGSFDSVVSSASFTSEST